MKNGYGYIMVGISGAGKSTQVQKIVANHPGKSVTVFSLDTIRLALYAARTQIPVDLVTYADAFAYCNEKEVDFKSYVNSMWYDALVNYEVIIVDNTNLTRKSRARWCNDLHSAGFTVTGVNVEVPLQVAIDRQKTRGDKSVPEHVVRDMFMRKQELLVGSEVDYIHNIWYNA